MILVTALFVLMGTHHTARLFGLPIFINYKFKNLFTVKNLTNFH